MAIVVHTRAVKYVADVRPVTSRLMLLTLTGHRCHFINAYAPQPFTAKIHKKQFYKDLHDLYKSTPKQGPVIIAGDFNARIEECITEEETTAFGPFTYARTEPRTWDNTPEMEDNRTRFSEFCTDHHLYAANTWFDKPDQYLATYKQKRTYNTTYDRRTHA